MNQKGFTLIEFMIALVLGMTVVLGITTLFIDSSKAVTDVNRAHRSLENSLFATDVLASELGLIGYWGEASAPIIADHPDWGPLREHVLSDYYGFDDVPICIGKNVSGYDTDIELAYAMEHPVASDDGSLLDLTGCSSSQTVSNTSQFVSVRRASTCAYYEGVQDCPLVENAYYIQTNGCYIEDVLNGGEINIRQVNSSNYATELDFTLYGCNVTAPIYTYVVSTYFVNDQEQLIRLYLDDDNQYKEEMLVEGVEHLSFQWFIDTDGDLEHDTVTDTLDQADGNSIRGVKIWMVVRGLEVIPEFTDNYVYFIRGQVWDVPTGNEKYSRMLTTQMIDINPVVDVQRNQDKGKGRK